MFNYPLWLDIRSIVALVAAAACSVAAGCGGRQCSHEEAAVDEADYRATVDELAAVCISSRVHEAECRGREGGGAQVETSCDSQIATLTAIDEAAGPGLVAYRDCAEARLAYHRCVLATPCETLAISAGITLCTAETVGVATKCHDAGIR